MSWMFVPRALARLAHTLVAAMLLGSIACPGAVAQGAAGKAQGSESAAAPAGQPRRLTIANKPWTRDFDKMLERRMIRVYAPFSRSLYFSDKGRERGIAVELVRDWERYLNIKYAKQLGKRPLTIYIAPATRDKLLPYLGEGLADVSIGNLTVTEERLKEVDFVPGDEGQRTINEIVVTGPKSPELKSLDDLSGKRVHVRKASSYYDSLQKLNERFLRDSKRQVELVLVPDALEDEDLMEMLDGCQLQRGQPAAVRVRELQLRTGQRGQGAQGSGEARPRPEQVVQQRRARGCRKDRHRDDDLRT
jgi:ABC-type amino acid transport substrate-binding protein